MGEMTLIEWAVSYIKYKDSVRGRIQTIEEQKEKNRVLITNKDGGKDTYLCRELLDGLDIKEISSEKIACLNKKDNVTWLINNWDLLKDKKATFIFVNVKKSESWAINPGMHHSITDKTALKPGLKSLFESIPSAD
ncbi:MAG: hypothetical protein ACP5N2_07755 [Candidatus Nanoarchaeia archaeon]